MVELRLFCRRSRALPSTPRRAGTGVASSRQPYVLLGCVSLEQRPSSSSPRLITTPCCQTASSTYEPGLLRSTIGNRDVDKFILGKQTKNRQTASP